MKKCERERMTQHLPDKKEKVNKIAIYYSYKEKNSNNLKRQNSKQWKRDIDKRKYQKIRIL